MMDKKEAALILASSLRGAGNDFSPEQVYSGFWYLHALAGKPEATLDGIFTADELAAIAQWMRDPKGVFEAL